MWLQFYIQFFEEFTTTSCSLSIHGISRSEIKIYQPMKTGSFIVPLNKFTKHGCLSIQCTGMNSFPKLLCQWHFDTKQQGLIKAGTLILTPKININSSSISSLWDEESILFSAVQWSSVLLVALFLTLLQTWLRRAHARRTNYPVEETKFQDMDALIPNEEILLDLNHPGWDALFEKVYSQSMND